MVEPRPCRLPDASTTKLRGRFPEQPRGWCLTSRAHRYMKGPLGRCRTPTQPEHRLLACAAPGPGLDPGAVSMVLLALVPADGLRLCRRNTDVGNPAVLPLSRAPLPQPLCDLPSGGCHQVLRCVKGRARTRTWLMLQPPSAPLPLSSSAPPKPRLKPHESLLYSVPTYSRPAPLAAKSRRHCYHKSAVKSLHASENLERDSLYRRLFSFHKCFPDQGSLLGRR